MNSKKNILLIITTFLFQACSDDVDFVHNNSTLKECTDAQATECRVAQPGVPFKKVFTIDEEAKQKADILFIIDTSGSMAYEQEHIRQRFTSFIDSLKNVDWRVAISTAIIDKNSEYAGSAGSLIPFAAPTGLTNFLDSTTPGAHELFGETIRRPKSCGLKKDRYNITIDDCDDHERAIYQANLIIAHNNETHFFRPGSHVNIVIVSDEDEKSNGKNLEDNDRPETLVANAASLGAETFTVHSIITRPGDKACIKGQGEVYGNIYAQISQLTNGIIGNVCDNDYTDQLKIIAGTITVKAQSLELPCALQEPPVISSRPVLDATYSFKLKQNKILFNKALPGDTQIVVDGVCRPQEFNTK